MNSISVLVNNKINYLRLMKGWRMKFERNEKTLFLILPKSDQNGNGLFYKSAFSTIK